MKISKLASALFAVLGTVLLVGSVIVSFTALNKPAKTVEPSEEANAFAQTVLRALDDGDLAAVEGYLYGKPSLGIDRAPADQEGKKIWEAYRDSISVTADEACFGEGMNVYQTAQVTVMNLKKTLSGLDKRAGELLEEKLDAQEDQADLLGEERQLSSQLRAELRAQALQEALAEPETVTVQITFQLIEKDGRWWVLPDQAMLNILSAGLN